MSINAMIFPQELFSVSTSGSTLTLARATKTANQFYASSGTTGTTTPSFRAIVLADLPTAPHGEMYMYDNTVPCIINTTNIYHAVYTGFGNNDGTLPPTNDTNSFSYLAGTSATISAFANSATISSNTTIVTTTGTHTLSAGEPITITGTTNYNGTYSVNAYDATHVIIGKAYVSNDATGSMRRPATLRALVAGVYRASFSVSGISAESDDVFKFELNRTLVKQDNIGARIIMTSGENNYRACAASGLLTLSVGDYVWLSTKNYKEPHNVTIHQCNVSLNRV
jgi:hypothetical protein